MSHLQHCTCFRRSGFGRRPFSRIRFGFERLEPRRVLAAPSAVDDTFVPYFKEALDVLANDSDPDSNFQIVSFTQPNNGGLISLYDDYGTPKLLYQNRVSRDGGTFTYTISDGVDQSTAKVTLLSLGTDRFSFASVPYIGVPGQLMSYTIASFEPNPGVTYVANAVWHDGLVTDVAVANSTVIGNSNASFTFWRTFTTVGPLSEGLVEAELHIRGSDGTLRLVESIGSVINTIILQPDPVQQSELTLIVGGLDNVNDQILFEPATVNSQPAARVYYNGSDMGAFAVERLIVYGQGGDDLIQVNAAIGLDARLYGQAGNDILVGGAGHDILIGGIGNDILYGFGGRDLVFGGLGQDFVQGAGFSGSAVGDDSDIVVGGYVTFDLEPKKLNDLALLWRSPSASYEDRITAARTTTFGLRYNETVFDDWSLDYVFGATDLDWFLVESTLDNFDAQSDETIN